MNVIKIKIYSLEFSIDKNNETYRPIDIFFADISPINWANWRSHLCTFFFVIFSRLEFYDRFDNWCWKSSHCKFCYSCEFSVNFDNNYSKGSYLGSGAEIHRHRWESMKMQRKYNLNISWSNKVLIFQFLDAGCGVNF